jgi:hypothetical protein
LSRASASVGVRSCSKSPARALHTQSTMRAATNASFICRSLGVRGRNGDPDRNGEEKTNTGRRKDPKCAVTQASPLPHHKKKRTLLLGNPPKSPKHTESQQSLPSKPGPKTRHRQKTGAGALGPCVPSPLHTTNGTPEASGVHRQNTKGTSPGVGSSGTVIAPCFPTLATPPSNERFSGARHEFNCAVAKCYIL